MFRAPASMKALSQASLAVLSRAGVGAVRGYSLRGHADGYVLSVQDGLPEAVQSAKHSGGRQFARLDTALALLRILSVTAVDLRVIEATGPSPWP